MASSGVPTGGPAHGSGGGSIGTVAHMTILPRGGGRAFLGGAGIVKVESGLADFSVFALTSSQSQVAAVRRPLPPLLVSGAGHLTRGGSRWPLTAHLYFLVGSVRRA